MTKSQDLQFKSDVESITYADVLKLRELKANHAIDLDSLEMPIKLGNEYVEVMRDFLESLNFSSDRIESCECRRRDGFIPHSWNNGGMEAVSYRDQYSTCENTGFDKTDAVLTKYAQYDIDAYAEENGLDSKAYGEWTQDQLEACDEARQNGDETIQFQARIIMTSATSANVDFYVSASDTPYHRQSDDKLELSIEFKTPSGMKRKLASVLKRVFVKQLVLNVGEAF